MNNKKSEEGAFLKQFVKLDQSVYQDFGLKENDPPDGFLIRNDRLISIEISKLFNRHGERIIQERKFVEKCQKIFKEETASWIENSFSVHWRFKFPLNFRSQNKKLIPERILQLTKKKLKEMAPDSVIKIEESELPEELEYFSIAKSTSLNKPYWLYENYWMSGELKEKELHRKIEAKNINALKSRYFEEYSENWLLLVIEESPHSSFAGFSDEGYSVSDEWVFDRIIIMEPKIEQRLYDLK